MVELLVISRLGGSYTSAVFPDTARTNPSVTLKLVKWKWTGKDNELAVDIPETSSTTVPRTVAGGFKRMTLGINVEGYVDATPTGEGSVQEKIEKLWNIFEFADPANTFATFRGRNLFGIASSANAGELKVMSLDIDEDAKVSEPAQVSGGSISYPKRAKFTMQIRKMKRSL